MPRRHTASRTNRLRVQARQHYRPRLETLEQRTLLACEVFVDDATRTLFVQGDAADNRIAVVSRGEHVQVNCDGFVSRVGLNRIDDVQVRAGGGNDKVITEPAPQLHLTIKGEDGDDTWHHDPLDVDSDDPVTPSDMMGGSGNDKVVISAARAAVIAKIIGVQLAVPDPEFQLFSRATGDLLAHLFVQETEAITLKTGDGNDRVEMHDRHGLLANIDWSIHTGGGDDEFSAVMGIDPQPFLSNVETQLKVVGGAGNDRISILSDINAVMGINPEPFRPTVVTRVNVSGGDGNDSISVQTEINAVMGVSPEPFLPNVFFDVQADGGAGDDTVEAHALVLRGTLVGFNPQPEPPIGRFNIALRGGLGDDDINAVMGVDPQPFMPNVVTEVNVNGGAGDDNISVLADINAVMGVSPEPLLPNVVTRVSVNGGEGHDNISVLADINAVMGVDPDPFLPNVVTEVNVNGGAGDDSISVVADINAVMGVDPDPFLPNVVTRMNINGGAGHDNISVAADINAVMGVEPEPFLPNVSMDVTVEGGVGNDVLNVLFHADPARPTVAALHVALLAGAGDDELRLQWTADAFSVLAFADGGSGFDTGLFSPGVRHVNVERTR